MTQYSSGRYPICSWALGIGLSLLGIPLAQAGAGGCPPANSAIPYAVPCHPVHPLTPAARQKFQQILQAVQRAAQAGPQPVPLTGIIPGYVAGQDLGGTYLVENAWAGIINGKRIQVYAGALRYNPETQVPYDPLTVHGFVIILKGIRGKPGAQSKQVYTPTAVGALRIIAAHGTLLTLKSLQGYQFSINIRTERLTPLASPK